MSVEIPPSFTEDIKIEQSAKGARVTVHVFGNDAVQTMDKAVLLYKQIMTKLREGGVPVAPIEIKA